MIQQSITGVVFVREIQIEKLIQGSFVPAIRATWTLRYPSCFTKLCITFKDADNDNAQIAVNCLPSSSIVTSTEIIETRFSCNKNVNAELTASDESGHNVRSVSDNTVYTGGKQHHDYSCLAREELLT